LIGIPVFGIITLTALLNWRALSVILATLFVVTILGALLAEGAIIAALFGILLPKMGDGAGKLALMIGLPVVAIVGNIFVLAKMFKVRRPGR